MLFGLNSKHCKRRHPREPAEIEKEEYRIVEPFLSWHLIRRLYPKLSMDLDPVSAFGGAVQEEVPI